LSNPEFSHVRYYWSCVAWELLNHYCWCGIVNILVTFYFLLLYYYFFVPDHLMDGKWYVGFFVLSRPLFPLLRYPRPPSRILIVHNNFTTTATWQGMENSQQGPASYWSNSQILHPE
jgi:hypothetical protein